MKVLIPTHGRAGALKTPELLGHMNWFLLVHDDEQAEAYAEDVPEARIIVTNVEPGPVGGYRQKAWAMQNLVEDGEWVSFMDDDLKKFVGVVGEFYQYDRLPVEEDSTYWRHQYNVKLEPQILEERILELTHRAEDFGLNYGGFSANSNCFYRPKKWRYTGFIANGFCVWRKTPDFPYHIATHLDDFFLSCEHMLRDGGCVMNQFVFSDNTREKNSGGYVSSFDSRDGRTEARKDSMRFLVRRYPGLLKLGSWNVLIKGGLMKERLVSPRIHKPEKLRAWSERTRAKVERGEITLPEVPVA